MLGRFAHICQLLLLFDFHRCHNVNWQEMCNEGEVVAETVVVSCLRTKLCDDDFEEFGQYLLDKHFYSTTTAPLPTCLCCTLNITPC